ncbi:MAG: hypothetical protein U9R01_00575 [candidate division WOR-3 bacterium]|nr:hypothetical protein [candidate division WOR-3 bacterium]
MEEDIKEYIRNKCIELIEERKGESFDDRCCEDVKIEQEWYINLFRELAIRGVDPFIAQHLFIECVKELQDEATKAMIEARDRWFQIIRKAQNDRR